MQVTTAKAKVTLPTDEQIQIERHFAAPAPLVYRAFTEPELVRRWWHAGRGEMTVTEIDLRVGGVWRYAMRTPDGTEVAFHGEYREIVPAARIVTTEAYEGAPDPGASTLNTTTFTAAGDSTLVTILVQAPSRGVRDAIIASGMEDGLQDALDLLGGVAAALEAPLIQGTDFVAVPTDDFEASCRFYGEVLGLPCIARYGQRPGAEFQAGNLTLAVMQGDAFGAAFAPNSLPIALRVADVAGARERLMAAGVRFHTEPFDSGVCHQAIFSDPAGNPLSLHHRYAGPKAGGDQAAAEAGR